MSTEIPNGQGQHIFLNVACKTCNTIFIWFSTLGHLPKFEVLRGALNHGGVQIRRGRGALSKTPGKRQENTRLYSPAAHKSQNNMKIRMRISNSFYEQENVLINEAPKLSQAA